MTRRRWSETESRDGNDTRPASSPVREGQRWSRTRSSGGPFALFAACGALLAGGVLFLISEPGVHGGSSVPYARRHYPVGLTQWDITTDHDALYLRRIMPIVKPGALSNVTFVKGIRDLLVNLSDETILSIHMKDTMPLSGQPEFQDVLVQVEDCAKILNIAVPPRVFVKQGDGVNAYVTGFDEPHVLVLTTGLLEKYKKFPDQLRFVIGHELGHIKCEHVEAHNLVSALVHLIGGRDGESLRARLLVPALCLELLHWSRASEISADRAGLLCVGKVRADGAYCIHTAEQALMRLLHATDRQVDADVFLDIDEKLEDENSVAHLLTQIYGLGRSHPFIEHRIRELRTWSQTPEFAALYRRGRTPSEQQFVIESISVANIPDTDSLALGNAVKCDSIVVVACGDVEFRSLVKKDNSNPVFNGLGWQVNIHANQKLIVDLLDSDLSDEDLIGSIAVPLVPNARVATQELRTSSGERAQLTLRYRPVP